MTLDNPFADYDRLFDQWRERNPAGTFGAFSAARIQGSLKRGYQHPTLNCEDEGKAVEDAESVIQTYEAVTGSAPAPTSLRICDYGCGSLRVGLPLIARQDHGCYIGLDTVDTFLKAAREKHPDILEKQPLLGSVAQGLAAAIKAAPDLVFAYNVASHIHPDEVDEFYENIRALSAKPGCIVLLHVLVSAQPVRFQRSGWAWPMDFYVDRMLPLGFVKAKVGQTVERNGSELQSQVLTFVQPAK